MVPSGTLSSTNASRFALKITEWPIVQDYLSLTHGVPTLLVAHVPNDEDWWDTVSQHSYANILSKRHKGKPSYAELMADRRLRWPDISTFNGPSILRFAAGYTTVRPPIEGPKRKPGRSEIYEIKPNNKRGKIDALEKLADIEQSYVKYGISGIYRRGSVYPFGGKRVIYFETPYLELFKFLVRLGLLPLGVRVESISIEVERPENGVLLYKICVDLQGADAYQRESAWAMAYFAVRMLLHAHNSHERAEVSAAAMMYVESLEPEDSAINPRQVEQIVAGRDLSKPPAMKLNVLKMVTEMESSVAFLRDAMYSRLLGAPGDRFFLCCDESWYQTNIGLPGIAKVVSQIRLMGVAGSTATARGASFIGLAPVVLLSADHAIRQIPFVGPAYQWAMSHLEAVLIIVGCSLIATAAVIAAIGTAGGAAPVALPVAGEALSAALAAGAGEMTGAVMVASGATEATAAVAVGATETVGAGTPAVVDLLTWARAAARLGPTLAEATEAGASNAADELLLKLLSEAAVKTALKAAVNVGSVLAGGAVIGLSARSAHAYTGPPSGQVTAASIGESVQIEVGRLHLFRVNKFVPTQIPAVPELYKPFDASKYAFGPTPGPATGKLYMIGCVEVA